jgi:hypothetical protein
LGFDGELSEHFLTRLHVRYTPQTATQDLMLYSSGLDEAKVTSFADDTTMNRMCIDQCGADATDQAPNEEDYDGRDTPADRTNDADPSDKSGCATVTGGSALALVISSALIGLRRRD